MRNSLNIMLRKYKRRLQEYFSVLSVHILMNPCKEQTSSSSSLTHSHLLRSVCGTSPSPPVTQGRIRASTGTSWCMGHLGLEKHCLPRYSLATAITYSIAEATATAYNGDITDQKTTTEGVFDIFYIRPCRSLILRQVTWSAIASHAFNVSWMRPKDTSSNQRLRVRMAKNPMKSTK